MPLVSIRIHNVRNLGEVKLSGFEPINIFYGHNGSGKTSLLEAIHVLGMARSFRGNSIKTLIKHGESRCVVFGEIDGGMGLGSKVSLGVQRELSGEAQLKVTGAAVKSVAQLVEHLPIQVINANSFELLTGAPLTRRQYMDWGVFHVEHRFLGQWQRFQRCIKQRNKLLRRGKISPEELDVWTRDLATSGAAISDYRRNYFDLLAPRFKELAAQLLPALGDSLELRYLQGWDKNTSYETALLNSLQTDTEQGYTHVGPQRADIKVMLDGRLAADTLSRGQQKLVVCGLKLAQGQVMRDQGNGSCTYLVDDLPSELDAEHGRLVCRLLADMGSQIFITCIGKEDVNANWFETGDDPAMFHVEHGSISPLG